MNIPIFLGTDVFKSHRFSIACLLQGCYNLGVYNAFNHVYRYGSSCCLVHHYNTYELAKAVTTPRIQLIQQLKTCSNWGYTVRCDSFEYMHYQKGVYFQAFILQVTLWVQVTLW